MYLTDLPQILTWQNPSSLLTDLHAQYISLLEEKLGKLIARINLPGGIDLEAYFDDLTNALPRHIYEDTLCEPEVTFRLLWPTHHTDLEAINYLRAAFISKGQLICQDRIIFGGLRLDATSDLARTVDVSGTLPRRLSQGPIYDQTALSQILEKLDIAIEAIRSRAPNAWRVVRDFTKLLHVLPDEDAPTQFSSGSSGQFVGRTVIANAHLEKISPVEMSEALVHEAIHSVLYMAEQKRQWVLDPDLYAGPVRIASPWTGNPLPLRPYLQACFVWYGLISFWSITMNTKASQDIRVRQRFDIALSGFQRCDLLSNVSNYSNDLSEEVKAAISEMQERIILCLKQKGCA